ncbi:hypothetical protein MMC22_003131 [Lobaria immixta]|nr:hypothetical protein [Lobaria immixta]
MDHHHTFDFVEGTLIVPIASEIKAFYPDADTYFSYFDLQSTASMRTALAQLTTYIALEGPYDGVLAYSHGAVFAATYMIQQAQLHPMSPPPFKCAIFLSGGIPADHLGLERDELRLLDPKDGKPLKLPTAHIWGANDELYPGTSAILSDLCDEKMRWVFVHEEGHDVPSARAKDAILGAARVIRRMVDMALAAQ